MTSYNTFCTDSWILSLPADWKQGRQSDGGSLYFESADGTKGLYIATWQLGSEDRRSPEDVVEAFQVADLNGLKQMQEYRWELLAHHCTEVDGGAVGMTDMLAAEKSYRTVGKILVAPPVLVRASFHDYACIDYAASIQYFAPIVESLRLYTPDTAG